MVLHSILLRWAEVILDPPALIQIVYQGSDRSVFAAARNDDGDDDVSSIGEDVAPQQTQEKRRDGRRSGCCGTTRSGFANNQLPSEPHSSDPPKTALAAAKSDKTSLTSWFQKSMDPPTESIAPKRRRENEEKASVWFSSEDEADGDDDAPGGSPTQFIVSVPYPHQS